MPSRCYCVFEGGGAKGIAHVGVLRALERSGLDLVGFSGTSAGAIVAALAAAGYSADDIFGPAGSILDRLDQDPRNKSLTSVNWPVTTPQKLLGAGWNAMRFASKAHWVVLGFLSAAMILPWLLHFAGMAASMAFVLMLFLTGAFMTCVFFIATGFATVKPVREAINQALALKVRRSREAEPPVTFAELEEAGGRPLRIIAANISTGKLVLFSSDETRDTAIADAVAASICLPIVFEPWQVNGDLHLDGGLVSNLPAWAFDAERARDRDAWTAAIEISDTEHKRPGRIEILKAAALTATFGSNMLNTRSVERLKAIRLKVDLELLQFDFDRAQAETIIKDAEAACEERLVVRLVDVPDAMEAVCREIRDLARTYFDDAREEEGKAPFAGRLRVGLFRPLEDDNAALQNEFCVGFEDDPDERLRIPRNKSLAGAALAGGDPLYAQNGEWISDLAESEDRWLRKAIWRDMKWCLCVPYGADGHELAVWIDSDEPLDLDDELREVTLGELVDGVLAILSEGLPEEPTEDDDES